MIFRYADMTVRESRLSRTVLVSIALLLLVAAAGCFVWSEDAHGNLESVGLPGIPVWKASKPQVPPQTLGLDSVPASGSPWLTTLNQWRQMAGEEPLGENPALSDACEQHAQYLVNQLPPGSANLTGDALSMGGEAHYENFGAQGYTEAGAQCARGGRHIDGVLQSADVSWSRGNGTDDINGLLVVPFHRLSLLAPWATVAGFGRAGTAPRSAGALALRGPDDTAVRGRRVAFPSAGSTVSIGAMVHPEWPNPLASCPGYRLPVGLPVTLQEGNGSAIALSAYEFRDETKNMVLQSCAFDSVTYRNLDPAQQSAGSQSLRSAGAIVLIPRLPLQPGHKYMVSLTINGATESWSFSVQGGPQTAAMQVAHSGS